MEKKTKKKIAVLCSDDAHHKYLIGVLTSRFNVVGVVMEPGRNQRRRLLQTGRCVDYCYAVYHHLRRSVFGLNAYRKGYFGDTLALPRLDLRVLTVEWINETATLTFLKEVVPDLTVVICTSILSRELLAVTGEITINVHGGFLPYYRGNHCFFFPFYRGEFDRIGSTLHFVDLGIDTGAIIENIVPPMCPADTPETLYCRAEKLAILRLAEWIEHWENGGRIPSQPQTQKLKLFRTRDRTPFHDIYLWFRLATGKLTVPTRSGTDLQPIR